MTKKLIDFGWDQPDTAFMRANLDQLEASPFDGTVYRVLYQGTRQLHLDWWGAALLSAPDFRPARADLAATPFRRLRSNFLRLNIGTTLIDWFDDFSTVLSNARLAARLAGEADSKGVFFDTEPVVIRPWEYTSQRDAATKTFQQYADQASLRGQQIMTAFQQGFASLWVVLTFGASMAYSDMLTKSLPLSQLRWGLMPAFMSGMAAACQAPAKIVDGNERAYGTKTAAQANTLYTETRTGAATIMNDPVKYGQTLSVGYGLWLDYLSNPAGSTVLPWNIADTSLNYYPPALFQTAVGAALAKADDMVWVYTEIPRWWSAAGAVNMPPAYSEVLWQGRGLQ